MSDFLEDLREFHRLMGTLPFWRLPVEQRHGALKGLWYSHAKSGESDTYIQAATREYMIREYWMLKTRMICP